MGRPSTTAYHLGYIVTAYAGFTCIMVLLAAHFANENLNLHPLAPLTGLATIIIPLLAAEPTRRREKPTHFGPANQITLFRAILIALVAMLIGSPVTSDWADLGIPLAATSIAISALALDGVDGLVARKMDCMSDYGARFDMELDAFFTLVLSILVFQWGHAGVWVLFCGLARYVWLGVQIFVPWFNRPLSPKPAFRRKTACVLGVGGLTLALFPWSTDVVNTVLAGIATGSLFISFAIDVRWLFQHRKEPLPD